MTERRYISTIDGETLPVRVESREPGTFSVRVGDAEPELVTVLSDGPTLTVLIGERVLELAPDGHGDFATRGGVSLGVEARREAGRAARRGEATQRPRAPARCRRRCRGAS
jgi:hypothetical protein